MQNKTISEKFSAINLKKKLNIEEIVRTYNVSVFNFLLMSMRNLF